MYVIGKDNVQSTVDNTNSMYYLIVLVRHQAIIYTWTGIGFELWDEDETGFTPTYLVKKDCAVKQFNLALETAEKGHYRQIFADSIYLKIIPLPCFY